ncbi:MAG TPA: SRPBCC family protein [Chloroflexota bacterium]|nr:SRPBCC family protein [Chloroflexota bacterium]
MSANTQAPITTQVHRVYIKATPEAIWNAITTSEWTRRYGYGGDVEYDLRPGGAYRALASEEMRAHGAPEVAVDGEVIEADPPRRLVQKWRMVMDPAMEAEGFTRLTYEIEATAGGATKLTIIHDLAGAPRLAAVVAGEFENEGAGGGWSWVLSDLKSLIETGTRLAG